MSFSTRIGTFQTAGNFKTYINPQETVTITRSIVNATTVSFTFTNANLANTNIGYEITGADAEDFADSVTVGQVSLDANGNATLLKTVTSDDLGVDKIFFVNAFGINNRITGVSGNVNILSNYPMIATGGNSFIDNGNVIHVFTANSNLVVTQAQSSPSYGNTIRALVVAAGGSANEIDNATGAGAGGLRDANVSLTATTYSVIVAPSTPAGLTTGVSGANSSFANITCIGGGGGVAANGGNGRNGGSGSGASATPGAVPGNGTILQGNRGGFGVATFCLGGGGGAGAVGGNGFRSFDGSVQFNGTGGEGKFISWVPTGYGDPNYSKYFSGGGSATDAVYSYNAGTRGPGGGGGGGGSRRIGLGGIVIVSYPNFTAFRGVTLA
jgi:hypothetical protein